MLQDTPTFIHIWLIDTIGSVADPDWKEWCIYYIQVWSSHAVYSPQFMTTPTNNGAIAQSSPCQAIAWSDSANACIHILYKMKY